MSSITERFVELQKNYPCNLVEIRKKTRIGLVQLSTDYVLENDWRHLGKDEVEIFSTRLHHNSELTKQALTAMTDRIGQSASLIAPGLDLDVMVYGCTSASLVIGDQAIGEQLTKGRSAIPCTNPWKANRAALTALKTQKVAVLAPYPTQINQSLYESLQQSGFEVTAFGAFQLQQDTKVPFIDKRSLVDALDDLLTGAGDKAEAILLNCTNLPVMQEIEKFEKRYNRPVVFSNQALFWHALRLAGNPSFYQHLGALFTDDSLPS